MLHYQPLFTSSNRHNIAIFSITSAQIRFSCSEFFARPTLVRRIAINAFCSLLFGWFLLFLLLLCIVVQFGVQTLYKIHGDCTTNCNEGGRRRVRHFHSQIAIGLQRNSPTEFNAQQTEFVDFIFTLQLFFRNFIIFFLPLVCANWTYSC